MNRMYFSIAAVVVAALNLASCDKLKKDVPTLSLKTKDFFINAGRNDYQNWTYVNSKTGETETHRDFSDWNYYNGMGEKKTFVKTEKARGSLSDVKIEWHIAIHPKAIRTNETEAVITKDTDLSAAKLPSEDFVKDVELKNELLVDMSEMMSGIVGYASSAKSNEALSKWLKRTPVPGEHGKYNFELNKNVFVVKCKDGSYAKVKFTDYRDVEGNPGFCKFSSIFVPKN